MIKSVTVTNYLGDSIKLILGEPEKSGFLIKSIEGLGPPKANINVTEISTSDGSMYNSSRLDNRNIVFELIFVEVCGEGNRVIETIEDVRQKSYTYFPIKKQIELVVETDNRIVKTTGYVESNEPEIFSEQEGSQISIICPDPFFYGTDVSTNLYSVEPAFEFPFSNDSLTKDELVFGHIYIVTEGTIKYAGEAEVGMTIYIDAVGIAKKLTIYNVHTRKTMSLDTSKIPAIITSALNKELAYWQGIQLLHEEGTTARTEADAEVSRIQSLIEGVPSDGIVDGDTLVIKTSKGEMGISLTRGDMTYNILNCLDRNSDWLRLTHGSNTIAFTSEEGISNLRFRIENKVVYEGV